MPAMPMTSPKHAAIVALAATITQRAGCAVTASRASVPCCTSDVNISVPAMAASTVVSHVEKMNVWLIGEDLVGVRVGLDERREDPRQQDRR